MNGLNEIFSVSTENVTLYFIIHHESFLQGQNESWEKALHSHIYYEILYSLGGDNRVILQDQACQLQKDTFTIVRPYQNHGAFFEHVGDLFSIGFSFEKNRGKGEQYDLYALLERLLMKTDPVSIAAEPLRGLFLKLKEQRTKEDPLSQCLSLSTLLEILCRILQILSERSCKEVGNEGRKGDERRRPACSPKGNTFHALCQINDALNARYRQDITPESMSEEYYISPKQINRYIFRQYGQTFLQRRNALRIAAAKTLLKYTEDTAGKISESVGYHSVNTFYSAFKLLCGMTPNEYRRRSRNSE